VTDDDALELLRSRSGLAIDAEGRFLHRGEPITHARTLAVLWGSLAPTADGRWLVRIGRESGYVSVELAPWVVRGVLDGPDGAPWLLLSDGTKEPLDPRTLSLGGEGVLRCEVKGGLPASFSRAAQIALGLALEERPPGSGRYELLIGGVRYPVRPA
jgi:hypothetical protein